MAVYRQRSRSAACRRCASGPGHILRSCSFCDGSSRHAPSIGPAEPDGRIGVGLRGRDARSIAGDRAGFGAHLEVLEPPEVRDELARIGCELIAHYDHS
ncbi:MAG: WYL domain-containing protein [Acidimicrobiia bacterium]